MSCRGSRSTSALARRLALALLGGLAACGEEQEGPPPLPVVPAAPEAAVGDAAGSPTSARTDAGWFRDVTSGSGLDFVLTSGGDVARQIVEVKGGGVALLDHDGDGDWDVFAPNGATLEAPASGPGSALFENRTERGGSLRFADVTLAANARYRRWALGATAGDLDGDGRTDLFLPTFGPDGVLWNGGGRFEEDSRTGLSHPGWSTGAALGDLDRDGDLDLYVARFLEFDPAAPPPPTRFLGVQVFAGPAGLPAAADSLYVNEGDGVFRDASEESGVHSVEPAYGLGVLVLDLDEDGHQDVFVGNDSGRNFLFAGRDGLRFDEVGLASGIGFNSDGRGQATMGIAVADVDGNGLPDIYTTNFAEDTNTLQRNRGGLRFDDRTQRYGLGLSSQPFLGWAAGFRDFDLDGAEDLLVFNGHVYPASVTEQLGVAPAMTPLLYRRGPGVTSSFELVGPEACGPALAAAHVDRGAAFGDLDGDGDPDVVVMERNGPLRLLRNEAPHAGSRGLTVVLEDDRAGNRNREGLGAVVDVLQAGVRQRRWQASGTSYLSTNARESCFGLAPGPATIEVHWPDGEVTRRTLESGSELGPGRVVIRRD